MPASFPDSVKSFTSRSAGQTIAAAHVNDLQDEVNAIESGLLSGTAPLNSSNSTFTRLSVTGGCTIAGALNSSNSTLAALSVTGGTTLAGTLQSSNSTVNNFSIAGGCTIAGALQSSNCTIARLSLTGDSTFASSTITFSTQTWILPAARPSTGDRLVADSTSGSTTTLKWAASASATSATSLRLTTDGGSSAASSGTLFRNNLCSAWAAFTGTPAIEDSVNVSSVTVNAGSSGWNVAFGTALASTQYAVLATLRAANNIVLRAAASGERATTGFLLQAIDAGGNSTTPKSCFIAVMGY